MTNPETEEKLRKLAALDGRGADANWLFYLSGELEERQEASDLLDILLFQKLSKDYKERIFLDPPSASKCFGEYFLGQVLYPPGQSYAPFGLREEEWIKHLLIVGMTGTGKTNLAFQILRQFQKRNKPFLVFDWKRNYRDLLQLPEFSKLKVFTVGRPVSPFHFNPLLPPEGMHPGEWLTKLVDVLKHAYFVGEGVEYLLREAFDWVYEQCGYYSKREKIPMFHHAYSYVLRKQLQGRMSLWKASTLRVLGTLCYRHGLGPVLNTDKGSDLSALFHSPAVLELDSLSDSDKIFLTEAIILWLYEFRKQEGKREEFKHALLIEEGHHILSQKKEDTAGMETIMETCLRQIREFGEAVIVIDQEPSKLSNSIKANTSSKLCFNLGNGSDILEMATCMGLNKEESEYLHLLEVGQAIVSLKERVFVPLFLHFPKIGIQKGKVSDESLVSRR